MAKTIVSIRMPNSLLLKLRQHAEKNHYLDVSEQVRSIVRNRYLHAQQKTQGKPNFVKNAVIS